MCICLVCRVLIPFVVTVDALKLLSVSVPPNRSAQRSTQTRVGRNCGSNHGGRVRAGGGREPLLCEHPCKHRIKCKGINGRTQSERGCWLCWRVVRACRVPLFASYIRMLYTLVCKFVNTNIYITTGNVTLSSNSKRSDAVSPSSGHRRVDIDTHSRALAHLTQHYITLQQRWSDAARNQLYSNGSRRVLFRRVDNRCVLVFVYVARSIECE